VSTAFIVSPRVWEECTMWVPMCQVEKPYLPRMGGMQNCVLTGSPTWATMWEQ